MINVSKQNKPSYECMIIAETAYELAKQAKEYSWKQYHCSTGFVFLAFAIEAMFIFYRRQVDSNYDKTNDRSGRKDFHKKTMNLCGIGDLLGSRDYQTIKKCLLFRDNIAHGDFFESKFPFMPSGEDEHNDHVNEILSQPSKQFRITVSELNDGICAAKCVDNLICENGYQVSNTFIERKYMPRLQPAFGVSGISTWL
ncbi:hypothetical protein BIY29_15125 [Brenneria alni]|uniref:Uncharacterized protein n=1 Tax=Brenneria alni TaxID=71656 RepID=A0A421DL11_9GAMM|nr:hypothetical protein [Brenneria alni]RLM20592.1 hypothetical protein BIY29_15125 [Brenneria alni]